MFAEVSISCTAIALIHGKPPPPKAGSKGIAPNPDPTHFEYAGLKESGCDDRAIGLPPRAHGVTVTVRGGDHVGHEAPDLLEHGVDRRRVDVAERVGGNDLVEAGDMLHDERDVAQRRDVLVHASRLAQRTSDGETGASVTLAPTWEGPAIFGPSGRRTNATDRGN